MKVCYYFGYILGASQDLGMSVGCLQDSAYHQRFILHAHGLCAEGANADVKNIARIANAVQCHN